MVFKVPNSSNLWATMNYTDIFLHTLYWNIGIFIIIFGAGFIVLLTFKTYLIKNKQIK
jgi:hypothetical protein